MAFDQQIAKAKRTPSGNDRLGRASAKAAGKAVGVSHTDVNQSFENLHLKRIEFKALHLKRYVKEFVILSSQNESNKIRKSPVRSACVI